MYNFFTFPPEQLLSYKNVLSSDQRPAWWVYIYIYHIINDIHIFLLYFFWASATFTRDYNIIRFWNPSIERCCHLMSVPPMVFKLTQCNLKMAIAIYMSHYIQMPIFLGLSGESPLIFVFFFIAAFSSSKPVIWQWSWWSFTPLTVNLWSCGCASGNTGPKTPRATPGAVTQYLKRSARWIVDQGAWEELQYLFFLFFRKLIQKLRVTREI